MLLFFRFKLLTLQQHHNQQQRGKPSWIFSIEKEMLSTFFDAFLPDDS